MKNVIGGGGKVTATVDLGLELSVNNPIAKTGTTVVFTIVVTNDGTDDASSINFQAKEKPNRRLITIQKKEESINPE